MFNSGLNSFNSLAPATRTTGLLAGLKKINFSNILNTTQKTLNIVNQAIPLVYQVKPIVANAKTIFKIMGAVKNDGHPKNRTFNQSINNSTKSNSTNKQTLPIYDYNIKNTNEPNFFI